jgi:hypothetical protein
MQDILHILHHLNQNTNFKSKYPITSYMIGIICLQHVNNATFNTVVIKVKENCEDVDQGLILKLEK